MGSVPLMLATVPGAEAASTLGVVIFSGVTLATLFTLFIVPAFYQLFARHTGSPNAVAHKIEVMKAESDYVGTSSRFRLVALATGGRGPRVAGGA